MVKTVLLGFASDLAANPGYLKSFIAFSSNNG